MSYIPDGQIMAVPPARSFPEPKRFRWRRQPPRPTLGVNTFRAFGWLSPEHEFPVGKADPRDVLLLERAVNNSYIWVTRGWHCCPFGPHCPYPTTYSVDGQEWTLGDASIVVVDDEGLPWVAPNLVLHYVTEHGYAPDLKLHDAPGSMVDFSGAVYLYELNFRLNGKIARSLLIGWSAPGERGRIRASRCTARTTARVGEARSLV